MKKSPLSFLLNLPLAFIAIGLSVHQTKAAGSVDLTINISSADGGSSSLVSWSFNSGFISPAGQAAGFDNPFSGFQLATTGLYTASQIPQSYSITGAGTLLNYVTSTSQQIASIDLGNSDGFDTFTLSLSSPISTSDGDLLQYTPSTDSYIIPVAISTFNAGTFSITNSPGTQFNTRETITINAVPEPSSYPLIGLGALALFVSCKRYKAGLQDKVKVIGENI